MFFGECESTVDWDDKGHFSEGKGNGCCRRTGGRPTNPTAVCCLVCCSLWKSHGLAIYTSHLTNFTAKTLKFADEEQKARRGLVWWALPSFLVCCWGRWAEINDNLLDFFGGFNGSGDDLGSPQPAPAQQWHPSTSCSKLRWWVECAGLEWRRPRWSFLFNCHEVLNMCKSKAVPINGFKLMNQTWGVLWCFLISNHQPLRLCDDWDYLRSRFRVHQQTSPHLAHLEVS